MNAMIKAAQDGVHVISLSLGETDPFEGNSPYTDLVKALTAQGIAIVAANGNDGNLGIYAESTPGNVAGVLAVGSVTNAEFPSKYCFPNVDVSPAVRPRDFLICIGVWLTLKLL
jgi:minor extracellular serine protease Vpr